MELVRGLIIVLMLALISSVLLHIADAFVAWYENRGKQTIGETARRVAEEVRGQDVNISDYDVWEKSKPYFRPLDTALVLAFLASILGVFIYTRERT